MAGVSAGGDGMEPFGTRPHREIVLIAMAVVLLVAGFGAWLVFKPSATDTEARASAAELGLNVPDDIHVESIDGGFRLVWTFASDDPSLSGPISFNVVETDEVSPPADLSTWEPKIPGAASFAEGEPPIRVLIDAGERSWIVTPDRPWVYDSDESARAAWYNLANSINFTPAT